MSRKGVLEKFCWIGWPKIDDNDWFAENDVGLFGGGGGGGMIVKKFQLMLRKVYNLIQAEETV